MKTLRDVLVIDDESIVLKGVERVCATEGLSVESASSAADGLRQMETVDFRLVLCDIMMEGMDGFQFLAEAARRGHRIPIVMTTGYSTVENAVRSLQSGAIDYLTKPYTADELVALLRRSLRYGDLRAEASACPPGFRQLGYSSWTRAEAEGIVRVGVSELFVRTLQGIRGVELARPGRDLWLGTCCATVVSVDGLAHGILCPASGNVLEANAAAADNASAIEADPYGAGWLYRLLPRDGDDAAGGLAVPAVAAGRDGIPTEGDRSWS